MARRHVRQTAGRPDRMPILPRREMPQCAEVVAISTLPPTAGFLAVVSGVELVEVEVVAESEMTKTCGLSAPGTLCVVVFSRTQDLDFG